MAQVSSRLDALAYIISPLLPESLMVQRVDKEGLDRGVGHPMALRAKHTHLRIGGKTCAKTDYKPFILELSITSL